jgi:hypothetical protein
MLQKPTSVSKDPGQNSAGPLALEGGCAARPVDVVSHLMLLA